VTGDVALAALPIGVAFNGAADADAQMRLIPSVVTAAKMIVRIISILPSSFMCPWSFLDGLQAPVTLTSD
jgi:hypothetical protein